MMGDDDQPLLARYAASGDESAFRELVERHLPVVLGAARRRIGCHHLACDVAQEVFAILARKAGLISSRTPLAGWLHTTTRTAAIDLLRSQARRQKREQTYAMDPGLTPDESAVDWAGLSPVLEDTLDQLPDRDRDALLLRYFHRLPLGAVAKTLGTTEEAARKRVSRALDALRSSLAKRGITTTSAVLAQMLPAHASVPAPAGLAASISSAALASAGTGTPLVALALTLMTKKALVATAAALLLAGAGAIVLVPRDPETAAGKNRSSVDSSPAVTAGPIVTAPPAGKRATREAPAKKTVVPSNEEVTKLIRASIERQRKKFETQIQRLDDTLHLSPEQKARLVAWLDERMKAYDGMDFNAPGAMTGPDDLMQISPKVLSELVAPTLTVDQQTMLAAFNEREHRTAVDSATLKKLSQLQGIVDLEEGQRDQVYDLLSEEAEDRLAKPNPMAAFTEGIGFEIDPYDLGLQQALNDAKRADPAGAGADQKQLALTVREIMRQRIDARVERLRPVLDDKQLEQYRTGLETKGLGVFSRVLDTMEAGSPR